MPTAISPARALLPASRFRAPWWAVEHVRTGARARPQPGRSYDELRWLLSDAAQPAAGSRPGSTPAARSRSRTRSAVDPTFHAHGAIAAALAQPVRLHEIAAASGASMEQVFDVVNAYDAIGRLTWTPRQRLARRTCRRPKPAGALSRLKWPFGKR